MSYIFSNRKMFIRVKRGKVQIGGRIKDHTEIGKFRQKHNKEQEKIHECNKTPQSHCT